LSEVPLPLHVTNNRDAAIVFGLLRNDFEVRPQLLSIKVEKTDAAGTAFPTVAFLGSVTYLSRRPSGAAFKSSIHIAATRPLSATLLHLSAVSARFSPAQRLAAAIAAAFGLEVSLAELSAPSPAGITATQQS
jgi:hypothetical protein